MTQLHEKKTDKGYSYSLDKKDRSEQKADHRVFVPRHEYLMGRRREQP